MKNESIRNETQETVKPEDIFECECEEDKKYRVAFDGASTGQYVVEFCQKCYDQDDKQFMLSMEVLF